MNYRYSAMQNNLIHNTTSKHLNTNKTYCQSNQTPKRSYVESSIQTPTKKTIALNQSCRNHKNISLTQPKQNGQYENYSELSIKSNDCFKKEKYGEKIGQIDELLSKFKTKYAILQQKYFISENKKDSISFQSKYNLIDKQNKMVSQFCSQTIIQKQNTAQRKKIYPSNNTLQQKYQTKNVQQIPRQSLPIFQLSSQSQIAPRKQYDKSKLRSTFSPSSQKQCILPFKKIRQRKTINTISKFQYIKDVESEDEFQNNMLQESVVISKLSDMINIPTLKPTN